MSRSICRRTRPPTSRWPSSRPAGCTRPTATSISRSVRAIIRRRRGSAWRSRTAREAGKSRRPGLGFPEGKIKTVFLDISGLFAPGIPHQVRLRTNLEIYWDYIAWATILPDSTPRQETPAGAHRRRPAFPGLVRDEAHRSDPARHARLRPPERHGPALARSRRLLHPLRRCAAAPQRHRRPLRDHEFGRRTLPALPGAEGSALRAWCATMC